MTRTKEYDYDEVLEIYKKLSNEKGRPLKYLEIDECNELPSKGWIQQNGGMAKIKDELGLDRISRKNNMFCNDCTKESNKCGYVLENCPLLDDSELYFVDTDYNSSTNLIEEQNKERDRETKEYNRTYLSDQKLEEVIKLKKQGTYWKDIAYKFGIKKITLYKKVQRYMGNNWENRGWR